MAIDSQNTRVSYTPLERVNLDSEDRAQGSSSELNLLVAVD